MGTTVTLSAAGVLLIAAAWLAWRTDLLAREVRRLSGLPKDSLELLQREVHAVRSGVDGWLREHLESTRDLSRRLVRLEEAAAGMERLGAGLVELQRALRPPRLRGELGERMLEQMLEDVLPRASYDLQHVFPRTGVRVDAAVRVGGDRWLPIDCKFPLDNFRRYLSLREDGDGTAGAARRAFVRDVRRHIDAVADKYVSPGDGGLDVALMYIPSESVFHEIASWKPDTEGSTLLEYARRRGVVPASPNTLHAYLSAVRMGLRGFRLQEDTRTVLEAIVQLQQELEGMRSTLETATSQARHALNNLGTLDVALHRVEGRVRELSRAGIAARERPEARSR